MSGRRCVACDGPEPFEPLYTSGGFTLVRCPRCALVFQHPEPSSEALAGLYYQDEELARRLDGDLRAFTLGRAREKVGLLRSAGVVPGGELLDVGCSSGAWLEVAGEAGWSGHGLEPGEPFAARARAKGLAVHTGTLEDVPEAWAARTRFSLITMWDVLEHLRDPLRALRAVRELLAPGGTLALNMPNVEGLYPRVTYRLLARPTGVWEHPELPAHQYDFSPRTTALVLGRAGFEPRFTTTTEVPFEYYRTTSLARQLGHRTRKGPLLRGVFEAVRMVVYPLARATGRGNALFMTARAEKR